MKVFRDYGFAWAVGALFVISLAIFLRMGWLEYVGNQVLHGDVPKVADYLVLMVRDITENWQSEFLEILVEVIALKYLFFRGSPMSRDQSDRQEKKIDEIRQAVLRLQGIVR